MVVHDGTKACVQDRITICFTQLALASSMSWFRMSQQQSNRRRSHTWKLDGANFFTDVFTLMTSGVASSRHWRDQARFSGFDAPFSLSNMLSCRILCYTFYIRAVHEIFKSGSLKDRAQPSPQCMHAGCRPPLASHHLPSSVFNDIHNVCVHVSYLCPYQRSPSMFLLARNDLNELCKIWQILKDCDRISRFAMTSDNIVMNLERCSLFCSFRSSFFAFLMSFHIFNTFRNFSKQIIDFEYIIIRFSK